jgi:hypothetical protein
MLRISNIIPKISSQFSKEEYNSIVRNLGNSIEQNLPYLKCTLTKENITIDDILSKDSKDAFHAFSKTANRSTGHDHPCDEQRWFTFIYKTLLNKEHLDSEIIRNLLIEDGWDKEHALILSIDYDYAFDAMKYVQKVQDES